MDDSTTKLRIVRTRSIPNVDVDRLQDSLSQIHEQIHTADGLRRWDKSRRSLVDLGVKAMAISAELASRGAASNVRGCWVCSTDEENVSG